jgi:hypothetical protein
LSSSVSDDRRQVEFLVALESTFRGIPFGVVHLAGVLALLAVMMVSVWNRLLSRIRSMSTSNNNNNKTA